MDVKFRRMSLLDSSYAYSAADYHGRRAPSEDHVAAHTTDRTRTINGAGTRKAERRDRRQHK